MFLYRLITENRLRMIFYLIIKNYSKIMLGKISVLSSFSYWVIHWIYSALLGYSWLNVLCAHEVVGLFVVTPLVCQHWTFPLYVFLCNGLKKKKKTSCKSNQNKYFQMLLSKIGSETTRVLAPWSMGRTSDEIGRIQGGMAIDSFIG